jgi:hypothetical protein
MKRRRRVARMESVRRRSIEARMARMASMVGSC